MANKAYSEMPSDTKAKETGGGAGMLNDDGRLKGTTEAATFDPKLTFSPNEDAPSLPQQSGVEGAK